LAAISVVLKTDSRQRRNKFACNVYKKAQLSLTTPHYAWASVPRFLCKQCSWTRDTCSQLISEM